MTTFHRIREQGTEETLTTEPEVRLRHIRRVVERKQYEKIDGTMIDLFTASVILKVYDALNDANKAKLASMPAGKMATVAYKLIS